MAPRHTTGGPDGLVVVAKPAGWTSHDVVAKSRGLLGTRKVGHAGTLDPDATGVLLLGVGRATKLLRFLSPMDKTYVGEVVLGIETNTLDSAGEVTGTFDMAGVTLPDVRRVAGQFTGPIQQVPPMVSAIKIGGQRLHKLARQGITVEREARAVTIYSLQVDEVTDAGDVGTLGTVDATGQRPVGEAAGRACVDGVDGVDGAIETAGVFAITVVCSSGTYIRSLAADIGTALGGGAHLRNLRREAVGPFVLAEAVALEALGPDAVRPMTDAVCHLPSVIADELLADAVAVGKVLDRSVLTDLVLTGEVAGTAAGDGPWAVLSESGDLLAVYEPYQATTVKPAVVVSAR